MRTIPTQQLLNEAYRQMIDSAMMSMSPYSGGLGNSQNHQQHTAAHSQALANYAAAVAGQQGLGNAQNTGSNDINPRWRAPIKIADAAWYVHYSAALIEARALRFAGEM